MFNLAPQMQKAKWLKLKHLIDLRLPTGFHSTSVWLKSLAAKHCLIEHISMISPRQKITIDSGLRKLIWRLQSVFKNPQSLSLVLDNSGTYHGCSDCDQTLHDFGRKNLKSIASILDRLSLTSLELANINDYRRYRDDDVVWSEAEGLVPFSHCLICALSSIVVYIFVCFCFSQIILTFFLFAEK